ncbi:VTT domain-containing protein, partial [Clostridium saudiense]|nr:VTT domain-containing protein [Clostridium saudiense]
MTSLIETLKTNSLLIIFIIMFLEALNLTGIPAIVIMPAIGVFIKNSGHSFFMVFAISTLASILGSITYYLVSSKFGDVIYNFFFNKFPSTQKSLSKAKDIAEKYGAKMCLIGRMIPTVRT